MVGYRRNRIAGATYFFTITLRDRKSDLLVREIEALRQAWRKAATRVSHTVIAAVVLPDHLHAVIRMDDETADFPRLWQDIKKGFTRRTSQPGAPSAWQSRYWERTVRDEEELRAFVDYVHINPLKHGLVTAVADWPHSTFHRYVRKKMVTVGLGRVTRRNRKAWRALRHRGALRLPRLLSHQCMRCCLP